MLLAALQAVVVLASCCNIVRRCYLTPQAVAWKWSEVKETVLVLQVINEALTGVSYWL
jgi:hypothetical protein